MCMVKYILMGGTIVGSIAIGTMHIIIQRVITKQKEF